MRTRTNVKNGGCVTLFVIRDKQSTVGVLVSYLHLINNQIIVYFYCKKTAPRSTGACS